MYIQSVHLYFIHCSALWLDANRILLLCTCDKYYDNKVETNLVWSQLKKEKWGAGLSLKKK